MKRRLIALVWLVILASCSQGRQQAACSEKEHQVTAFVDVNLVPMTHEGFITGQSVVVEGTRIVDIGPATDVVIPACATVIDGAGAYWSSGLRPYPFRLWSTFLLAARIPAMISGIVSALA